MASDHKAIRAEQAIVRSNVNFLQQYRDTPDWWWFRAQLIYTFAALGPTTPQALLAAAYLSPNKRADAEPFVWQHIWHDRIYADLRTPLTINSRIYLCVDWRAYIKKELKRGEPWERNDGLDHLRTKSWDELDLSQV